MSCFQNWFELHEGDQASKRRLSEDLNNGHSKTGFIWMLNNYLFNIVNVLTFETGHCGPVHGLFSIFGCVFEFTKQIRIPEKVFLKLWLAIPDLISFLMKMPCGGFELGPAPKNKEQSSRKQLLYPVFHCSRLEIHKLNPHCICSCLLYRKTDFLIWAF